VRKGNKVSSCKAILVTGCSGGFGRLIAEGLAREGHQVFASMRGIQGANAKARVELEALAQRENLALRVVEVDVTNTASIERAVTQVVETTGRIDVLVNNAGVAIIGLNEALTLDQAKWIFDTNFFGYLRMDRAVLPYMRKQGGGLLVHVASVLARVPLPFMGIYCASKAAIEVLAETFRYELSSLGIDSLIVEPGAYPTNMVVKAGIRPADDARAIEYGPLAQRADTLLRGIAQACSGSDSQEVADAVAKLIKMPIGKRPLRTLVGQDALIACELNDTTAQTQNRLMEAVGVADLMTIVRE
jgi:NAD(P)-dependent dehydrogenase (short-subunit alcohol dehydrogenase family)